jgi:hypothetical protein
MKWQRRGVIESQGISSGLGQENNLHHTLSISFQFNSSPKQSVQEVARSFSIHSQLVIKDTSNSQPTNNDYLQTLCKLSPKFDVWQALHTQSVTLDILGTLAPANNLGPLQAP